MKIAVWNNLGSGGGKRALYNHVKELLKRGHYIESFCPDTADTAFMPLSVLVKEHVFPLKDKLAHKTRIFKQLYPQIGLKTRLMLEHCKNCAAVINAGGFDVLFANSSVDFYMAHIGRYVNIPKLIYLGEPYRFLYEAKPEFLWKAPKFNSNIFKYSIGRLKHLMRMYWYSYQCREEYISACSYDFILVNSFYSRESVKRAYNLESKVCYLGIDTDIFNIASREKDNYVMGLGYVQEAKGIETAINSLAKIDIESRPSLIWVGNNKKRSDYIAYIEGYAKALNVNLVIKTSIGEDELLSLLSKARVFLYFPFLEPFGLAPLEANACGTAVISIAEAGPRETIKNGINGFVIPDLNYVEIAEKILLFSRDVNFAVEMGMRAREHVRTEWSLAAGTDNIEKWLNLAAEKRYKR